MCDWNDIESIPRDGSSVVILAHDMEVEARFCPGEWSEHHEYGREYNGPVLSCFDDMFQIELEETSEGINWGRATHWRHKHPSPSA